MKKNFAALTGLLYLTGCASYSQVMIRSDGLTQRCVGAGAGLIGIGLANSMQDDCVNSFKSTGYLEIEKAGAIGIYLVMRPGVPTINILKVYDNSPAAKAGIHGGDQLISVDGQKVQNTQDASLLLFGVAGSSVSVATSVGTYELVRAPYSAVFGTAAPAQEPPPTNRPGPRK